MNFKFKNKKISGILSVIPKHCVKFIDEMENYGFSKEKCLSLQKVMGFDERRIVEGNECGSDLALYGMEYLFSEGKLRKDEISAVFLITQTPDHFIPPTSAILHGKLGLNREVLCIDINQGCTGYLYGILQSLLLLEVSPGGKVVLINCDTLSRKACPHDRNIFPLLGDAGAITIIESTDEENEILLDIKIDGTRSNWLMIPAGAMRQPSTEHTREIRVLPDGNRRSEEDFYMNGSGVFTFTQTDVPTSIKEFFKTNSRNFDEIDYFMFHQPNRFMLEKLARKLGIPNEKIPSNIVEKFGNSSSASIPVTITHNINNILLEKKQKICMAGFGVGLSWGTLIMDMGPLEFCRLIEK